MTTLREDLQAAVEALESAAKYGGTLAWSRSMNTETKDALSRLRARLEQVDAEPVAWMRNDRFKAMTDDEKQAWRQTADENDLDIFAHEVAESYSIPLYASPTPAAAPEFDSAPQVSRNPQTGIKPAVDVERLELPPMPKPLTQVCLREVERGLAFSYWRTPNENYHTDISLQAYARAALRMHLTGGK